MASCDPKFDLEQAFRKGIASAISDDAAKSDPQIKISNDSKHGDFQCNAALAIARAIGANPRDIAAKILAATPLAALGTADIAGPGFINIRLGDSALHTMLDRVCMPDLGIEPAPRTHAIVVDLCGVNVAKQMHVGHLRSTILGDVVARLHERLGRKVFRENHLGDWGLPIAMTMSALKRQKRDLKSLTLADLNHAYRAAQLESATDEAGLEAARTRHAGPHRVIELEIQHDSALAAEQDAKATLLRLQAGDAATVAQWQQLIDVTMTEVLETARVLGVDLTNKHSRGESFYRDKLAPTVQAFIDAGLAQVNQGAMVVHFADRERPLLIRKADGGFLYSTTDLAAVHHRVGALHAGEIIYVVDARQRDHFRDVFDAIHLIGWDKLADGTQAKLSHLAFGSVLGTDKKPLKTRSGELFTLKALLDEAIARGTEQVRLRAKQTDSPTEGTAEQEIADIGRAVGIAAVKYADLSGDPIKDYVFDLDRMIAFEGDTGPYIQYAHARIASLLAKSDAPESAIANAAWTFNHAAERALVLAILAFPATIKNAADLGSPQRVCSALHELANSYATFYQACPVLKAPDEATRLARLRLSHLTKRVLAQGLHLLGMDAPNRM